MTYVDNDLRLANGLSLAGAGPVKTPTGSVIDLSGLDLDGSTVLSNQDVGIGKQLSVQIYPGTALDNATSMQVQVVLSAAEALTSPVEVADTGVILLADWNDSEKWPFILRISPNFDMDEMDPADATSLRYLGLIFTEDGTNPTAGTVTADLVIDEQSPRRFYPTKSEVL